MASRDLWRLYSHTGRVLPGDSTLEVRAGPPVMYESFAVEHRLFMVRNARKGNDWLRRADLMTQRLHHPAA